MGRPFKVVYSPDQFNAPTGGVATQWSTPYGGVHVQMPENMIGPQYTPFMNNMMLRNGEIKSRPTFHQILPGPDGNNIILGCGSFLSANQIWHTFCFTSRGLWQLVQNWPTYLTKGQNPWVLIGGALDTTPVAWVAFQGILYFSNTTPHLLAWDGAAAQPLADVSFAGTVNPPPIGTITSGGLFLGELDNHIIVAYQNALLANGSLQRLPVRVAWSNNGFNPTLNGVFGANLGTSGATFDVTVNPNAGFNDFLDVPDIITGLMTLGQDGYVFRQNGITKMTPTGNGIAPFDFNHLWSSQNGIGNVYPFTIAQYGNMGVFISFEQIYQITPGGMQPIGGGARDAILADLAICTGPPKASIDRGFQLGYTYMHYHLRIPQTLGTKSWVFSTEEGNWSSWFETGVWPTGIPNECWV